MPIRSLVAIAIPATILVASNAIAADLLVPSAFPTIQSAINAAVDGDSVLIAPGTYFESIDYLGKSIVVRGTGSTTSTVIDANDTGRVVRMVNVGPGARLERVTLRDGTDGTGGGIRVEGPATIHQCRIEACQATSFGGGIWASGEPTISDCDIMNNIAANGGGIRVSGEATIVDCSFLNNSATNNGGAVHADGEVSIEDSYTEGNGADRGRAFWFEGGPIDVRRTTVIDGLGAAPSTSSAIETNCTLAISNSEVLLGARGLVVQPGPSNSIVQVVNCTFADSSVAAIEMPTPTLAIDLVVRNSILHSDGDGMAAPALIGVSVQYSHVTGGWAGIGNIETDRIFLPGQLWTMDPTSPCCDAGKNLFAEPFGALDGDGRSRFAKNPLVADTGFPADAIVDMGATERQSALRFVNQNATGANTGLTWADAYVDLQDALDDANALAPLLAGDVVVLVAEGNYRPDRGTNDRSQSFRIEKGIFVVGGFSGADAENVDERDPISYPTTLGGAIGGAGTADNSYHVVRIDNDNATSLARLIGLTIQRGNANGLPATSDHRGGGVLIESGEVEFQECVFRQNEALNSGAAVLMDGASDIASFHRCRFYANVSQGTGSAISVTDGGIFTSATLIHGNDSVDRAAIFLDEGTEATLTTTTVADNISSGGNTGGILVQQFAALQMASSIVWKNSGTTGTLENQNLRVLGTVDVSGSNVQGWSGALGGSLNAGTNPDFMLPFGKDRTRGTADDNYRLQPESPCIDSGDDSIARLLPGDLDGNEVPLDDPAAPNTGVGVTTYLDRGCYEAQPAPCAADLDGSGTVDAADLAILLGAWGGPGLPDLDGNSVVDAADLAVLLGAWGPC